MELLECLDVGREIASCGERWGTEEKSSVVVAAATAQASPRIER